jgi:hypothetical protein
MCYTKIITPTDNFMEPTYLTIYQALLDGSDLSDIMPYMLERELPLVLVHALGQKNAQVFAAAQKELNAVGMAHAVAIPSSYKHNDVHAVLAVAHAIGSKLHSTPSFAPNPLEHDFIRVWNLAAKLDDLTFFDELCSHAVRLDITASRFPEKMFDASSKAIRWDLYSHLATRNELTRLQHLEQHCNYLETVLANPPSSVEEMMKGHPIVLASRVICESIQGNAQETFEWLVDLAKAKPCAFLVQMVSGVAVKSSPNYLQTLFDNLPTHQQYVLHFFDSADKSGQSTQGLTQLLGFVDQCSPKCLKYLASKEFPQDTARRTAIGQYAQSLMQKKVLSKTVKGKNSERKKARL